MPESNSSVQEEKTGAAGPGQAAAEGRVERGERVQKRAAHAEGQAVQRPWGGAGGLLLLWNEMAEEKTRSQGTLGPREAFQIVSPRSGKLMEGF